VAGTGRPALRRCISTDPTEFATTYWAQIPLLSPASRLRRPFDDLFSVDAVDELVSRRALRTPFVRMAKDGAVLDPSRYTRSGGAGAEVADQVADDLVLGLFADGATLVLQGLHRMWPPLVAFSSQLAAELGSPVQINGYVTPPSSRGFSAHYDVHDVFVLQISGEKRWVVHAPVHDRPLRSQPWTDRRAAVAAAARDTAPVLDAILHPGDCLYLPRGYLHAAEALGDVSIHLTAGVHPITRYAVVEALTALVAADPDLRASLPLGLDVGDPEQLADEVAHTVRALVAALERAEPSAVSDRLWRRLTAATRPAPLSPLTSAAAAAALTPLTAVRVRPQLRHRLTADRSGVRLELPDRQLQLPAVTEPALRTLVSGVRCLAGELPGLDADDGVVLVRRLLREGVVVPDLG